MLPFPRNKWKEKRGGKWNIVKSPFCMAFLRGNWRCFVAVSPICINLNKSAVNVHFPSPHHSKNFSSVASHSFPDTLKEKSPSLAMSRNNKSAFPFIFCLISFMVMKPVKVFFCPPPPSRMTKHDGDDANDCARITKRNLPFFLRCSFI